MRTLRGKRLVVLIGQRKALAIAVPNQGSRRRWVKLREHLTGIQSNQPMNSRTATPCRITRPAHCNAAAHGLALNPPVHRYHGDVWISRRLCTSAIM